MVVGDVVGSGAAGDVPVVGVVGVVGVVRAVAVGDAPHAVSTTAAMIRPERRPGPRRAARDATLTVPGSGWRPASPGWSTRW